GKWPGETAAPIKPAPRSSCSENVPGDGARRRHTDRGQVVDSSGGTLGHLLDVQTGPDNVAGNDGYPVAFAILQRPGLLGVIDDAQICDAGLGLSGRAHFDEVEDGNRN